MQKGHFSPATALPPILGTPCLKNMETALIDTVTLRKCLETQVLFLFCRSFKFLKQPILLGAVYFLFLSMKLNYDTSDKSDVKKASPKHLYKSRSTARTYLKVYVSVLIGPLQVLNESINSALRIQFFIFTILFSTLPRERY